MKKVIQAVIEKMIEMKWLTVSEHIVPEAIPAMIAEAIKEIKVKDFIEALF